MKTRPYFFYLGRKITHGCQLKSVTTKLLSKFLRNKGENKMALQTWPGIFTITVHTAWFTGNN